jgi:hypothetical protein
LPSLGVLAILRDGTAEELRCADRRAGVEQSACTGQAEVAIP